MLFIGVEIIAWNMIPLSRGTSHTMRAEEQVFGRKWVWKGT